MTAAEPPLWLDGWDLEPCGDLGAVLDRALAEHAAQRRRHTWTGPIPDAWVSGRPAYNVAVSIDTWPEGAAT